MSGIDWLILLLYFGFVLGIGIALRGSTKTSLDFFLAGRAIPAWVCGLAFLSANLGAQEVIGMGASGAKYGIATSHFYWIGAIPAMVFIGIFMMPFYYGSRARSVPEYLRLRFDEKTRALNAVSFAVMTVFSSGISMYAMAKLIQTLHVLDAPFARMGLNPSWIFHTGILVSAAVVLVYIFLGGLTSAIYNEVLQFFLIVAGFLPLAYVGLRSVGGWTGLKARLDPSYTHAWAGMTHATTNPLGVEWFGLVMGLGFVLSFGYWCTDFLVVQRAMAANSMDAARRTPLIAAVPKMLFPVLVILPGLIAIALPVQNLGAAGQSVVGSPVAGRGLIPVKTDATTGEALLDRNGRPELDYDLAIPQMLLHYFPPGMLGLGMTALLASFMSGMAGNVTAFNTVWTWDIYHSYVRPGAPDRHYVQMGRYATVGGIALSIAAAYLANHFNNIMDMLQLVFAFVNAPLFATFLLGMFWKRATGHGAFAGLLSGTCGAAVHHALTISAGSEPGIKGAWIATLHTYPSEMAQNFWTAIFAWTACFLVTIAVSLSTAAPEEAKLVGLVHSLTPRSPAAATAWYKKPGTLAVIVLLASLALNFIFR
ncbi:MAG TPA: sodium:solute symporter family protein [Candidatus Acidoferrales bacterium]|nr:sodium:solute symporter family protein [Candidatus Acidoferrales bacterium]